MKKIFILFITLIILTGCHDKYKVPTSAYIEIKNDNIAVYDEVYLKDFEISTNVKIDNKNIKLNTDEIGKQTVEIPITYKNKKYIYKLDYNVYDDVIPIFLSYSGTITVKLNDDVYPCSNVVTADNYDRNVKCIVEGYYDLNKIGEYKVEYVIKDSSNNENRKNLTIKVVEKIENKPTTPTKSKKLPFNDVIKNYKNDDTMIGIDISRWQGDIDFNKVKEAGCEFVMMRIGVNSDINKDLSMDSYYLKNIKGAKEAGLKVGVYLYTAATNPDTAINHAKWVINSLDGVDLELGVAFDWENWSKFNKYKINIHDLNSTFDAFALYIKSKGYNPMLYSSKSYLERIWENKNNYDVWLAHYTDKTSYQGSYYIWQMSNKGRINGINEDVDIDILYKKQQ